MVMGLVSAKGNFSCPFCVIPKEKWANCLVGKLNALEYQRKSSRKLGIVKNRCCQHAHIGHCTRFTHGVVAENMIKFIQLEQIMILMNYICLFVFSIC
jgi:hypothetical protein